MGMRCADLNDIELVSYLASIGINPVNVVGDFYYYLSPIRSENNPSFRVERSRNKWTDFGIEVKRKSFVDFIMAYHNIDAREVVRRFNNNEILPGAYVRAADLQLAEIPKEPIVKIGKQSILHTSSLLCYLKNRRIDLKVADQYCCEVQFTIHDKKYYGIGFKNNSGGFEIRNPFMKAADKKDVTTVDNGASVVRVFEGFMNFLTYMTLHKNNPPQSNYLILNSAHLMRRKESFDFMEGHEKAFLYLDNDKTGDLYTHEAIGADAKRYEDRRFHYATHGDLNEWAIDRAEEGRERKKILIRR
ncbi:Toprim-like [Mucilaginibacter pineti]|uniref:Toprim-like n=1 Tax=Mucilaginibacter pineti TaxID=1391627 RepID=A0A1G7INK7_9SPHI|nr:toprim domain-containing protein [Mucilaginibacter pineti]SDF14251.1 Toprim-like [Mucilaginibacter pineti]